MFEYYKFEDGTLVNLYGVDSVKRYRGIVPIEYKINTPGDYNRTFTSPMGSTICSITDIVESGYGLKLVNISEDDYNSFLEALKGISNGFITKDDNKYIKKEK